MTESKTESKAQSDHPYMTISISPYIHKRAKIQAVKKEKSMKEYIEELIEKDIISR